MGTQSIKSVFLMAMVLLVAACTGQIEPGTVADPIQAAPSAIAFPVQIVPTATRPAVVTATLTLQPQRTPTPEPTTTTLLTATMTPTATTIAPLVNQGCPKLVDGNKLANHSSTVLFTVGRLLQTSPVAYVDVWESPKAGIWAVSPASPTPILVQTVPENQPSLGYLSPEGTILLRFEYREKSPLAERTAIFFDLLQQKELSRFSLAPYGSLEGYSWLPNGLVRGINERERIEYEGEDREYLLLDPITATYEIAKKTYDLPNYMFFDTRDTLFEGYASVNPADTLILYSRRFEKDRTSSVVLMEQETGKFIWEHPTRHVGGLVTPVWNRDGSNVLFTIVSPLKDNPEKDFYEFIRLNTTGDIEELRGQPYPATDKDSLRHISWSPNEHYIEYALWTGQINRGKGFVVDTVGLQAGEICHPDGEFLTGVWTPQNQFAYLITVGKEDNERHQLYLLDVPSWQTQLLYEAPAGLGIELIGGTTQKYE